MAPSKYALSLEPPDLYRSRTIDAGRVWIADPSHEHPIASVAVMFRVVRVGDLAPSDDAVVDAVVNQLIADFHNRCKPKEANGKA